MGGESWWLCAADVCARDATAAARSPPHPGARLRGRGAARPGPQRGAGPGRPPQPRPPWPPQPLAARPPQPRPPPPGRQPRPPADRPAGWSATIVRLWVSAHGSVPRTSREGAGACYTSWGRPYQESSCPRIALQLTVCVVIGRGISSTPFMNPPRWSRFLTHYLGGLFVMLGPSSCSVSHGRHLWTKSLFKKVLVLAFSVGKIGRLPTSLPIAWQHSFPKSHKCKRAQQRTQTCCMSK